MSNFDGVEAYPLSWPIGWERTARRALARFEPHTLADARDLVLAELRLLGAKDIIISTNVPLRQDGLPRSGKTRVDDPGAAVYFSLSGKPHVLACDKWTQVVDNLWAIAKHVDALRGQHRWGVGTMAQAFAGFAALPAATESGWWEVLGVAHDANLETVQAAYRRAAKAAHPDGGGSEEAFLRVQAAWEQAKKGRQA